MAGMTGTFNATVQAEINGQSTAPIGGPTASSAGSPGSTGATSQPAVSHSPSSSASAAKSSASNGANSRYAVSGFGALIGVAAVFGIALWEFLFFTIFHSHLFSVALLFFGFRSWSFYPILPIFWYVRHAKDIDWYTRVVMESLGCLSVYSSNIPTRSLVFEVYLIGSFEPYI
jgi:hypothetical protein